MDLQTKDGCRSLLQSNINKFQEFLEQDLKSRNEVGWVLKETDQYTYFREGDHDSITFTEQSMTDEDLLIMHTHPSISIHMEGLSFSETDLEMFKWDNVKGMIVLSQDMFELHWKGVLAVKTDDEIEEYCFKVDCDGVPDGPAEERRIENLNIQWKC